jgi:hypothetical protein
VRARRILLGLTIFELWRGVRITRKFRIGFKKFRILKIATRNLLKIIRIRHFGSRITQLPAVLRLPVDGAATGGVDGEGPALRGCVEAAAAALVRVCSDCPARFSPPGVEEEPARGGWEEEAWRLLLGRGRGRRPPP